MLPLEIALGPEPGVPGGCWCAICCYLEFAIGRYIDYLLLLMRYCYIVPLTLPALGIALRVFYVIPFA